MSTPFRANPDITWDQLPTELRRASIYDRITREVWEQSGRPDTYEAWRERYDASARDATLGVRHVWTNVECPAYRTFDPADCECQ